VKEKSTQRTSFRWLYSQHWLYEPDRPSIRADRRRLVFSVLRWASRLYSIRYRIGGLEADGPIRLQLGSGRTKHGEWVNADINPVARPDLWMDLRDRWPVQSAAVSSVYARHCLEHFTEGEVKSILTEAHRVLEPGGGLRIGVPSLAKAIEQYLSPSDTSSVWARSAKSPGRQFWQYITDRGNHPIAFDFGYLEELLRESGFSTIRLSAGGVSDLIEVARLPPEDSAADTNTLYVECIKLFQPHRDCID
jgi:methyltransferase family protein